jgi:hypothetical protein
VNKKKLTLISLGVLLAGLLVFVGVMLAGKQEDKQGATEETKQEASEGPNQEANEGPNQESNVGPGEGPNQETKKMTKQEKAETKKDKSYLDYVPTISVAGQQIELYEFGDCISNDDNKDKEGPGSCERVTEEAALKGKTAATFEKGAVLEINNIEPSGELEDKNSPTGGVRRIGSFALARDGESLGPGDINTEYKELGGGEYIETMVLPSEPGYYTGVLDNSTPTGSKNYVFHFNIK